MLPPLFIWPWRKPGDPTHPVLRVALGHARNCAFSFSSSSSSPVARSFPARICTHLDYTYRNCGGKFAQKLTSSIQFVAVFLMGFFCYFGHVMEEKDDDNNPKTEVDCRNEYISPIPTKQRPTHAANTQQNNNQHQQQKRRRTTTTTAVTTTTSSTSRRRICENLGANWWLVVMGGSGLDFRF